MKKIFKFLIAIGVVVAIVVVTNMILNHKNTNEQAYNLVYEIEMNYKKDDCVVKARIDDTVVGMLSFIQSNNLVMTEEINCLTYYRSAVSMYDLVKDNIINYGVVVNDVNNNKFVSEMDKNYKELKNVYDEVYGYLKDTYYKIDLNSIQHVETVQAYIKNFVVLFKTATEKLNGFYYNAGLVFAKGSKNLSNSTNLSKLQIAYYSSLVYTYFTADETMDLSKIKTAINSMMVSTENIDVYEYLNIKNKIDNLMNKLDSIDLLLLANKYPQIGDHYFDTLEDDNQKNLVTQFIDYVVEV